MTTLAQIAAIVGFILLAIPEVLYLLEFGIRDGIKDLCLIITVGLFAIAIVAEARSSSTNTLAKQEAEIAETVLSEVRAEIENLEEEIQDGTETRTESAVVEAHAETTANTDVIVDESEETDSTATLVKNESKVLTIMTSYYQAMTNEDIDTMKKLEPGIDEEQVQEELDSSEIESYSNIITYSKEGLSEGDCVVYVCFDGKLEDYETLVPSLSEFYLKTDDDGDYYIAETDGNTEIEEFLEEMHTSSEVQALMEAADSERENALEFDPVLREFMAQHGMTEESEPETESEGSAVSESDETESMVANDSVNVRSEPSTESNENIIGGLYLGDSVTKTGETDDGWTVIDYNGVTGYVKSEFLSTQEEAEESE